MKLLGFSAIIFIAFLTVAVARPNKADKNCGYKACPVTPSAKINVHLVPHTHDDVGWLKTVDQYFYAAKPLVQKAGVEVIIDSVISELLKDPAKRFVYVESAFFSKWWGQQTDDLKEKVKNLVNQGRLEFIGGAWSMNDEAATHYQSIIDQFAYGLKFLNETFGECGRPRVGWQIDPFGHSKEMASIFAGMGYDGLFFARLDWRNKTQRFKDKAAEMIWHSSESLGADADLFTGILYNHYSAPPGFCFDYLCNDEPIIDDGYERNVEQRVEQFLSYVANMTKRYVTNNVMLPMGDDFTYQDAGMYYKNMDKLIKYTKGKKIDDKEVNIFYSTPSCYLKSLNEANVKWPTESNDFFPYATDIHTYWAGYFTSRPTSKRYERIGNNALQVCKKLLAIQSTASTANLNLLREAMGIMQHHDAITGTEKQNVADDYAYLMSKAIAACDIDIEKSLRNILKVDLNKHGQMDFTACHNLNQSQCLISKNSDKFVVTLVNPLNRRTYEYIRIPVGEGVYNITNADGKAVKFEKIRVPKQLGSDFELVFRADIDDITSYYIEKTGPSDPNELKKYGENVEEKTEVKDNNTITVGNGAVTLTLVDGFLREVTMDGKLYKFNQTFVYFEGAAGNNQPPFENRSSGAYIYRPLAERSVTKKVDLVVYNKTNSWVEVQQTFNEWVSQVIRLYENENFIEFEWQVGPIPTWDGIGKEIVTRFSTDIESNDIFYTDSNGREMVKRKINRSSKEKEFIPSNFYPITTKIAIEDENTRMAILTDRAQGASCLKPGECEVLIHRKLLHDDAFGVGEALTDTTIARGKFVVLFGKKEKDTIARERKIQLKKLSSPWPVFSKVDFNVSVWQTLDHKGASNIINAALPEDINLMTLEPFDNNKILLRLENIYEKEAGGRDVEVNLNEMAKKLKVSAVKETTLDGNQWLEDTKRMPWQSKEQDTKLSDKINFINKDKVEDLKFTLKPMQIRTFIMTV